MDRIVITEESAAGDFAGLALCVHALTGGLPVTARSLRRPGVQVENGEVKSESYTGPLLEQAIAENRVIKGMPPAGAYKGIPVTVAPLRVGGKAIAAFGVVDVSGSLDLKALMDQYAAIHGQVEKR